jgi:hydroxypyruvate isomerase
VAGLYFWAAYQTVVIMPKFAANLSFLFADQPFPERFKKAAETGFKGVEYLFPYDYPAREVAEWLRENDLEQVLFNLAPGDWAAGERGLACLPQRQGEFAESVEQALNYAMVLDCKRLHCMAGLRPAGHDEAELEATYIANLRYAADRLATIGATVMLEPINSRIDMPGYWLDDMNKVFRLQTAVDRNNVKVQYDIYHAQIMAGDLARTLAANIQRIGHIQIADNPGRHEPGTGEINYPFLFDLLDRVGYDGWVGCEYRPLTTTEAGLGWLTANA